MFASIKKFWKYLGAKLNNMFNEAADPKIQLEQAITEAQEQHRQLTEQAANVIANQKQTQMRLDAKLDELEKANNSARQAVLMADEATKKGDTKRAAEMTSAAESFANRLIALESEVEGLRAMNLDSTEAANRAKAAVNQNSMTLQKKLAEKQRLMSQLDQAKMQEKMNSAMSSLSVTVGQDVPTLDEVKEKIEARHAKAMGMSELAGDSVESKMLEVEQAAMSVEAQSRLSQIRSQLGLDTAPAEAAAGTPAAAAEPAAPADGTAEGATGA